MSITSRIARWLFCSELAQARRHVRSLRRLRNGDTEGDSLLKTADDRLANGNIGVALADIARFELIVCSLSREERAILQSIRSELAECQFSLQMLAKGALKCFWTMVVCLLTANPLNYIQPEKESGIGICSITT